MKTKILKKLRNSEDYISGQSLCKELGVSRTAIWKVINQLKEEGYVFDAIQNKGYKISEYPDLITKSEIESQLDDNNVIKAVQFFDETDSTNTQAKLYAEKGAADGTLFVAEKQEDGRGRRGHGWISPSGSGIWMTLLLRPDIEPVNASMLTIVSAMAVTDAVKKEAETEGVPLECQIKWPNDVVVNKKKVCGILTEMSAQMDVVNYVVIGIGINVNTTEFDESIKATASSLYVETGKHFKRSRLIKYFSESFTKYYDRFMKTQNLSDLKDDYNSMLVNKNNIVKIINREETFTGTALGIDDKGELEVVREDGSHTMIVSGEVSVRGLYGYV